MKLAVINPHKYDDKTRPELKQQLQKRDAQDLQQAQDANPSKFQVKQVLQIRPLQNQPILGVTLRRDVAAALSDSPFKQPLELANQILLTDTDYPASHIL